MNITRKTEFFVGSDAEGSDIDEFFSLLLYGEDTPSERLTVGPYKKRPDSFPSTRSLAHEGVVLTFQSPALPSICKDYQQMRVITLSREQAIRLVAGIQASLRSLEKEG